jgi:hypothetical protein
VWFVLDLLVGGRVTAIGAATAIIVGCVGITPAAGYISPTWAMALGAIAAVPSYVLIQWRPRTRLDETLDVLGAHGLAGLTGIVFIGFFAQHSWNGLSNGLVYGHAGLLGWQSVAALVGPAYAFGCTYLILRVLGLVMPLRVPPRPSGSMWPSTARRPTPQARARFWSCRRPGPNPGWPCGSLRIRRRSRRRCRTRLRERLTSDPGLRVPPAVTR